MSGRSSYAVQQLLTKMKDPDSDFRFMALNDLISETQKEGFGIDDQTELLTLNQVLDLMSDANGEVKNLAVKALAHLTPRLSEGHLQLTIDKLITFTSATDNDSLRDISSLALKTVTAEIGPTSKLSSLVTSKLLPQLLSQLKLSTSSDLLLSTLDLISDIFSKFEISLKTNVALQEKSLAALTGSVVLESARGGVKKRGVVALGNLVACSGKEIFESLYSSVILPSLKSSSIETRSISIQLISAIGKTSPKRLSKKISVLIPLMIDCSKKDDDELRDLTIQALEVLAGRCAGEMADYTTKVVEVGVEGVKWDPNYAGEDEDMDVDEEEEEEEEEEDEEFGDEYSDDDDLSWKVRRSSTKLLGSIISTRPELLSCFYKTISPVLISRFSEREESVRIELWNTFGVLISQTKVWGGGSGSKAEERGKLKRKRGEEERGEIPVEGVAGGDKDESAMSLLKAQGSKITKGLIKQLGDKSLSTKLAGFQLLNQVVLVLPGCLNGQISALIPKVESSIKIAESNVGGLGTSLKIEILKFLKSVFENHEIGVFEDKDLERLGKIVIVSVKERFHKISSGGFEVLGAMVATMRPVGRAVREGVCAALVKQFYGVTGEKLKSSETDNEVKEYGIIALGQIIYHFGDLFQQDFNNCLGLLLERLKNENTRFVSVGVVKKVVGSQVCEGPVFEGWVNECVVEVGGLLKRRERALKVEGFACLDACLERFGSKLPQPTLLALISDIEPLLTDHQDLNLLPLAITTYGTVLTLLSTAPPSAMEKVYLLTRSSLLQGSSLSALVSFFGKVVERKLVNPLEVVEKLSDHVEFKKIDESSIGSTQTAMGSFVAAAKCIGVVVDRSKGSGSGLGDTVVKEFGANIGEGLGKSYFSLLTLGEVGRVVDFSGHQEVFQKVLEGFKSSSEDLRVASAIAAGNIAVGNPSLFLPVLLAQVAGDSKRRYLGLQSLKEFIIHAPNDILKSFSNKLWKPLFENCELEEEGIRNIAAECIGKLTLANPAEYLPLLQQQLQSPSSKIRAAVISAIRFTFVDDTVSFDEQLSTVIVSFLSLMQDSDLEVRRLALSTLNAVANSKPAVIRDYLPTLLPQLYGKTMVDESLIRTVVMGPFKLKVDDGLEARKSAYECMYTFLDHFLNKIDLNTFMDRLIAGLGDEDAIKSLCYLILIKLGDLAPSSVTLRLDSTVPEFQKVFERKPDERNSVKQDIEKLQELQRSACRCVAVLSPLSSPTTTPKFNQVILTCQQGPLFAFYKEALRSINSNK